MMSGYKEKNVIYSFILPIFNPANTLIQALEALSNQKYKNIELIVVDDSNKSNEELINQFQTKIKIIKYLKRTNSDGLDGAFNYGIKNANGDVIVMFTDDNIPDENFLLNIDKHYKNGSDCVIVRSKVINKFSLFGIYQSLYENKNYSKKKFKPHWSEGFSVKKKVLISVGAYENVGVHGGNDNILSQKIENQFKVVRDFTIKMYHYAPSSLNEFYNQQIQRGSAGPQHDLLFLKRGKPIIILKYILKFIKFSIIIFSQIFVFIQSLNLIRFSEKINLGNFFKIYLCLNLKKIINTYAEITTIIKFFK